MRTLTPEQFEKEFGADALKQLGQPQQQTGGMGSFAKGFGKGLVDTSVQTARLTQNIGQGVMAAVSPTKTFQDIKQETGFQSLQGEQAQQIDEILKSENNAEKAGKLTAFIAEMFLPTGSRKIAQKGLEVAGDVAGDILTVGQKASQPLIKGGQEVVESVAKPENIMQRVARINAGDQTKFQKVSGESVGEFLTKRKIFGSSDKIATQLVEGFQKSKSKADDALSQLQGTFKPTPVKTILKELLEKEVKTSSPGALSPDLGRVRQLSSKFQRDGLDMSEINEVKRLYERNVKLDFLKQNLPDSVKKANNLDNAIRSWQFKQAEKMGLKNLPQLNKETQAYKMLADALGKKLSASGGNNAITLTDWIVLSGGDPTAIAGFITKKAFSSESLQSRIAQQLSKNQPKLDVVSQFGQPKPDLADFLNKVR
jgi:hypothetical protein